MKRVLLLMSLSVVFVSQSMAQTTKSRQNSNVPPQRATEATSGIPAVLLGTIQTTATSREKVLAYPRLLPQAMDCEVTGFDIAITANGKTWGPVTVKGAVLTDEVKDKIKETDAPPAVRIAISNIHIRYNGQDMDASPINIEYSY